MLSLSSAGVKGQPCPILAPSRLETGQPAGGRAFGAQGGNQHGDVTIQVQGGYGGREIA